MNKDINLNKYNNKRLKLLLKGLLPSFIGIFLPKKSNRIIFNSTLNEAYDFNTKYLFEYFIKNNPEYEAKFVINLEEKRDELNKKFGEKNNYFIETESLSGMWYALRAKTWIASGFETPVGGFFLKMNRFSYLLGHGIMIKACVFLEKQLPWHKKLYYYIIRYNFSHYLVTSKALIDSKAEVYKCNKKQLVLVGEPSSDCVFDPKTETLVEYFGESILEDKNVIYAPTWRQEGEQKLFPFSDIDWEDLNSFLVKNNINIFLRLHPSFEENIQFYKDQSKRINIIDTSIVEDINESIGFFDLIITDYSSVHIGCLLLEKPVLFLPYDLEKYENKVGFTMPYDEVSPGPKPSTYQQFKTDLARLLDDSSYYQNERVEVSKRLNDFKRNSSKMNAEFIINKLQNS